MWLMLQQPADDYVVATGCTTTVRDIGRIVFEHVGLDRPRSTPFSVTHPRPSACWTGGPEHPLEAMITEMVDADLARLRRQA